MIEVKLYSRSGDVIPGVGFCFFREPTFLYHGIQRAIQLEE